MGQWDVLDYLQDNNLIQFKASELAENLNLSKHTVNCNLSKLIKAGLVKVKISNENKHRTFRYGVD